METREMNANELADELKNVFSYEGYWESDLCYEAATMLRQQQAEIEALKVCKFHLENDINRLEDQVNELLVERDMKIAKDKK